MHSTRDCVGPPLVLHYSDITHVITSTSQGLTFCSVVGSNVCGGSGKWLNNEANTSFDSKLTV